MQNNVSFENRFVYSREYLDSQNRAKVILNDARSSCCASKVHVYTTIGRNSDIAYISIRCSKCHRAMYSEAIDFSKEEDSVIIKEHIAFETERMLKDVFCREKYVANDDEVNKLLG